MDRTLIHVGLEVRCKVKEDMEKPFTGRIEKIYENAALIQIEHFDSVDTAHVEDLNSKIVINFKHLHPLKQIPIKMGK